MIKPRTKSKPEIITREPRKKTQGIFDNIRPIQTTAAEELLGLTPAHQPQPSPTPDVSLTPSVSHASEVRPTPVGDYALRDDSLTPAVSHTPHVALEPPSSNLWASMPETKGYSKQFHAITDHLYRLLDPIEQAVYTQLFRLTHGFTKPTCIISLPKLSERANVGTTAAHGAIKRLISKGLVEKRTWIVGKGKEQGVEFSLPLPAWLTPNVGLMSNARHASNVPIKENTLKETHTNTDAVRVSSRFNLKECRQYAEHLRSSGQGITNPGGYATTIHRTGEADELIERFLHPPAPSAPLDASQCPDCRGTGWWYPKGQEMGVARCKHERLASTNREDTS